MCNIMSDLGKQNFAHKIFSNGKFIYETLQEHSEKTEEYFYEIINKLNLNSFWNNQLDEEERYIIKKGASFHDIGKINPCFQHQKMDNKNRLGKRMTNSNHSLLSAYIFIGLMFNEKLEKYVREKNLDGDKHLICIVDTAYMISRHHSNLNDNEQEFINELLTIEYDENLYDFLQENDIPILSEIELNGNSYIGYINNILEKKQRISKDKALAYYIKNRIIFSLICTSDFIATNDFCKQSKFEFAEDVDVNKYFDGELYKSINSYRNGMKTFNPGDINKIRSDIAIEAENTISNESSLMYNIESPCGAGKTNTGLLSACTVVKKYENIKKIIYTSPFNAITDQNVEVFKGYFNNIQVINSSSQINKIEYKEDEYDKMVLDYKLNNFSFTATSHIHLFGILFGTRKEHIMNIPFIANSVIIMDEIQAYKPFIWKFMIEMLKNYCEILNIKIIFMSATLPDLNMFNQDCNILNLIPNKKSYFSNPLFRDRVQFSYIGKITSLKQIIKPSEFYNNKKVLYEFIIKKTASEFYDLISFTYPDKEIYLLDGDTPISERQRIIKEAKKDKDIIIVSTQVIEAGVDLDFDYGFKDSSLPDSEIQFLGRINRSCKRTGTAEFFDYDEKKLYKKDVRIKNTIKKSFIQDAIKNNDNKALYDSIINELINLSNHETDKYSMLVFKEDCIFCRYSSIEDKMELIEQNANIYIAYKMRLHNVLCDEKSDIKKIYNDCIEISKHYMIDIFEIDDDDIIIDGKNVYELSNKIRNDNSLGYATRFIYDKTINILKNYFTYTFFTNNNSILCNIEKITDNFFYTEDSDRYIENNRINRKAFYNNNFL